MPSEANQRNALHQHDVSPKPPYGEPLGFQENRWRPSPMDQSQSICSRNHGITKYSADGRPFNPDLDLSGNCYTHNLRNSPPNLRGRPLNIDTEVERDKQISCGRAQARATAASENSRNCAKEIQMASRYQPGICPMTEVTRGANSNVGIPRLRTDVGRSDDKSIPYGRRLPRPTSCPAPLTPSRDRSSSYMSHTPDRIRSTETPASDKYTGDRLLLRQLGYPGRTTTRTIRTTTTRILPTQRRQPVPSDTLLRDTALPNTILTADIIRYKDQIPLGGLTGQTPLRTTEPPLITPENASEQSLCRGSPTFQNDVTTTNELTFDSPTLESTRYRKDIIDHKGSSYRDTGEISQQISPHQMLQVTQVTDEPQNHAAANELLESELELNRSQQKSNQTPSAQNSMDIGESPPVKSYEWPYTDFETTQQTLSDQQPAFDSETIHPLAICGSDYDNSAYKYLPNTFKVSSQSELTEPPPVPVSAPCSQDTPISTIFRCLAKKLSSTLYYLSSFAMSQNSSNSRADSMEHDASSFHETSDKVCSPKAYDRNSLPMNKETPTNPRNPPACDAMNRWCLVRCNGEAFDRKHLCNATRSPDVPGTAIEPSYARNCGRVQFDSVDDVDQRRAETRKPQCVNVSIEDPYCPDIPKEMDGCDMFNNMLFNLSLGEYATVGVPDVCEMPPSQDRMIRLEEFSMRIDKERNEANKKMANVATDKLIEETIENHFSTQNATDLNSSIKSLLLSEAIVEHDQIEHDKASSFTADLHTKTVRCVFPESMFVVYIGRTKPSVDIAE